LIEDKAMMNLHVIFGLMIFPAGGALLSHLGAGSVPNVLKPAAHLWVKSGGSPQSFSFFLWGLFALIAFAMIIFIGVPLYTSLMDLGRGFK
jgi:hypothetical protein